MNNKEPSYIENYLQYGIDLLHRRIYFGYVDDSEIDTHIVNTPTVELMLRAIDKMLDISNGPIEIHMSSYGGDPYMMLALYDKIQESPCKFIFYGRGMIMSSATWIMCGCDERYLSENTTILIHDGTTDISDDMQLTNHRINSDEQERLQRRLEKIYADNSYMGKKFWETISRRDSYLTSDEAIKLGLVDAVIEYRKRGNYRKGVRSATFSDPTSKTELNRLIKKLYKRIKLDVPTNLTIEIKEEEFEEIKEYDRSEEELKKMGMMGDTSGKTNKTDG